MTFDIKTDSELYKSTGRLGSPESHLHNKEIIKLSNIL